MLLKRSCVTHLLLLLAIAAPAAAQQHRVYIFGGGGLAMRQMPVYQVDAPPLKRSSAWGLSGGGGIWVRQTIGIEGSIAFQQPQHVQWFYSYLFASEAKQLDTADRDVPVLARLRYAARTDRRVGVDLIAGGGWAWHRAVSKVLASCGDPSRYGPCVPLPQPRDDETLAMWERALTVGIEVPIRVASHAAVAPSFHALVSHRRAFMTGYDHRGPVSGGGAVFSFGAVMSWRDR